MYIYIYISCRSQKTSRHEDNSFCPYLRWRRTPWWITAQTVWNALQTDAEDVPKELVEIDTAAEEAPPQEPTAPEPTLMDQLAIFLSEENLGSQLALNLAVRDQLLPESARMMDIYEQLLMLRCHSEYESFPKSQTDCLQSMCHKQLINNECFCYFSVLCKVSRGLGFFLGLGYFNGISVSPDITCLGKQMICFQALESLDATRRSPRMSQEFRVFFHHGHWAMPRRATSAEMLRAVPAEKVLERPSFGMII